MTITQFQGPHRFLSNFWPCLVQLDGRWYHSVEAAYQAAKTLDLPSRVPFEHMSPGDAKRAGRHLSIRPDWPAVKLTVMRSLLLQKFAPGTSLRADLLRTGDQPLQEGNTWNDRYWGIDLHTGLGDNHLGKLLMGIRDRS